MERPRPGGCACGGTCPRCAGSAPGGNLSATLRIGAPGDAAERAADGLAEAALGGRTPPGPLPGAGAGGREVPATAAQADRVRRARAGGAPLDTGLRAGFEPGLGADLSQVRVHTGPEAHAAADALHAEAFALGNDLVFGEGRYSPATPAGRKLIAHELAHVAQHESGGAAGGVVRRQILDRPGCEPAPRGEVRLVRSDAGYDLLVGGMRMGRIRAGAGDRMRLVGACMTSQISVRTEGGGSGSHDLFVEIRSSRPAPAEFEPDAAGVAFLQQHETGLSVEVSGAPQSAPRETRREREEDPPAYRSPEELSGSELDQVVLRLREELLQHPGPGYEHDLLQQQLDELELALSHRQSPLILSQEMMLEAAEFQREHADLFRLAGMATGLPGASAALTAPLAVSAFTTGFLAGAYYQLRPDALRDIDRDIREHPVLFNLGAAAGVLIGAGAGIYDAVAGLMELLSYVSLPGLLYRGGREAYQWITDFDAQARRRGQDLDDVGEILLGLMEFAEALLRDPAFLTEHGEELGRLTGIRFADFVNDDFHSMSAFEKGRFAGEIEGRILIEIAMMFLGPEEWIERGGAALGEGMRVSRGLARAITDALERIPGLRRLIQLRRARQAEEGLHAGVEAERLLSEGSHLAEGSHTVPGSGGVAAESQAASAAEAAHAEASVAEAAHAETSLAEGAPMEGQLESPMEGPMTLEESVGEDVEQAFDAMATEEVEPAMGPHPGPTVPEQSFGFTAPQISAFRRMLGRPLTDGEIEVLGDVWRSVANPQEQDILSLSNSRRLFNNQRNRFWRAVREDGAARQIFADAGCIFPASETRAPFFRLASGETITMTIDHILERQIAPQLALDPGNLRIAFLRENTVVLRLLHEMDPFQ